MKTFAASSCLLAITVGSISLAALRPPADLVGAELPFPVSPSAGSRSATLQISRDRMSGKVQVSWSGKGVLKQASTLSGRFKPAHVGGRAHITDPEGEQMVYRLESASSPIFSANIVGYVNLQLPHGLSLIANPLLAEENTVGALFPEAPDGTQVLKYVPGVGYEVSTFDELGQGWTNPDMDLSPGVGFFYDNPSSTSVLHTFIGEVLLGTLVNHLPAGFSTKGALLPQAGSINDVQGIPGQPGDVIRLYENDSSGGGGYVTSVFSATENAWVPDQILHVGQGFVSEKQNAQDWVRVFTLP